MIFNKSNPTVKVEGINEIDIETAKEKKTFKYYVDFHRVNCYYDFF